MRKQYLLKFKFNGRVGVVTMDVPMPCNQWLVELCEDINNGRQRNDVAWLG